MQQSNNNSFSDLSNKEKKEILYQRQLQTLELFLERNAIDKNQYDKSLRDLTEKIGMQDLLKNSNK